MLSSKRIKELENENEELKALIQGFNTKEEKLKPYLELLYLYCMVKVFLE